MINTYVEKIVQLVRGSSFRNESLQNPYFNMTFTYCVLKDPNNLIGIYLKLCLNNDFLLYLNFCIFDYSFFPNFNRGHVSDFISMYLIYVLFNRLCENCNPHQKMFGILQNFIMPRFFFTYLAKLICPHKKCAESRPNNNRTQSSPNKMQQ